MKARWRILVPHDAEVEIGVFNTVTIRRDGASAVKLTRRIRARFVLLPITTEGRWLELRV